MPKRAMYADALARLLFGKPLKQLDRFQRDKLKSFRALNLEAADREREERLARDFHEEDPDHTSH
jgi:hypothetical protein